MAIVHAHEFVSGVPPYPGKGIVEKHQAAPKIDFVVPVFDMVDNGAVFFFRLPQRFFGLPLLGDIDHRADIGGLSHVLGFHAPKIQPGHGPVLPDGPKGVSGGKGGVRAIRINLKRTGLIVRMHNIQEIQPDQVFLPVVPQHFHQTRINVLKPAVLGDINSGQRRFGQSAVLVHHGTVFVQGMTQLAVGLLQTGNTFQKVRITGLRGHKDTSLSNHPQRAFLRKYYNENVCGVMK
jgi:hypothetical protein